MAFTLVEMLAASAIFVMMVALLFSLVSQVSSASSRADVLENSRQAGRAALEVISRDLEAGLTPLSGASQTNFVMNDTATTNGTDNIFWMMSLPQGTVSSSVGTNSDVAVVGYFVRPASGGNTARLCRLYVATNSIDAAVAQIDTAAAADSANSYQGLVAEGVLGLWVTLYDQQGNVLAGSGQPYSAPAFPATADVSMVIADTNAAATFTGAVSSYTNAQAFLSSLYGTRLGRSAQILRTKVSLGGARW